MFMKKNKSNSLLNITLLTLSFRQIPPGWQRITCAFFYGLICHVIFGLAVGAMIVAMFFGMSESLGKISKPWSYPTNLFLVLQFPLTHSFLLSKRGGKFLNLLAPTRYAETLRTTTYAITAALQLLMLFVFWTPSGIVWWRAEGLSFYLICSLYAFSWLLLIKASLDAGAEVQSGALGWMSLAQGKKPIFPDMPTQGLFRFIRQPIYVSFALTLWTVPTWTPDQLVLATTLTLYCFLAPILKEKRFKRRYGTSFAKYQDKVPYAIPNLKKMRF